MTMCCLVLQRTCAMAALRLLTAELATLHDAVLPSA
jgi:hypothetical protein